MSSIYYKGQKYTGPTLDLGSGSLTTDDKTIVGAINELDAEVEKLKTVYSVPLSSSTENISGFFGKRTGNVIHLSFSAINIPSNTWTDIAVISKPPLLGANAVVANSSVSGYGRCDVQPNGTIRVYHTNGSTSSFYGISIVYVCSAG